MRAFVYHPGDSFLHRLNPLTKFLPNLPLVVVLSLVTDPATPAAVTLLALGLLWGAGRLPWRVIWAALQPVGIVLVGLFWTTALFYQGQAHETPLVLPLVGPTVSVSALWYAVSIALRVLAIYTFSQVFILTTDPVDFVRALVQQGRLSPRLGYGVLAGYRFIPLLESELQNLRAAYRVRGIGKGRGPLARARQVWRTAIPLLALAVRRAERVALAMEARAFGALPTRTYYRQFRFQQADLLFLAGLTVVLAGLLGGLAALGWLGQLNPWYGSRIPTGGS